MHLVPAGLQESLKFALFVENYLCQWWKVLKINLDEWIRSVRFNNEIRWSIDRPSKSIGKYSDYSPWIGWIYDGYIWADRVNQLAENKDSWFVFQTCFHYILSSIEMFEGCWESIILIFLWVEILQRNCPPSIV